MTVCPSLQPMVWIFNLHHICELLAINLLTYISNWFFFSGSTLTHTEINVVSALSLYVLINIIRAVCFQ